MQGQVGLPVLHGGCQAVMVQHPPCTRGTASTMTAWAPPHPPGCVPFAGAAYPVLPTQYMEHRCSEFEEGWLEGNWVECIELDPRDQVWEGVEEQQGQGGRGSSSTSTTSSSSSPDGSSEEGPGDEPWETTHEFYVEQHQTRPGRPLRRRRRREGWWSP